jgi:outer membrane immunogenic protein
MKSRITLATVAVALATMGSAGAADLARPVYKAAPPPLPVYSWTGCYVGAGVGYGLWNQDHQEFTLAGAPQSLITTSGGRGWLGDVQVGCDYQFAGPWGNWVIGAFADYDWADIKGDHDLSLFTFPFTAREKLSSQWSVGGRLGWLPYERLLVFVSGGYTQARFDGYTVLSNSVLFGGLGAPSFVVNARDRNGWFIGSGYEYALPWFPGLTWKTEYRFSEFRSETDTIFFFPAPVVPAALTTSTKFEQTVRTNLTWRFNFGGPVVAKY